MNAMAVVAAPTAEETALWKAVGLDKVPPEQRALALNIANRYGLDLMLKHVVLIDGRPYISRDGLLHIAHRSGQFDGMQVTEPVLEGGFWHCTATVWRKDMSRGFEFTGRYPAQGGNAKYAPEMATKTAESHAFRRAFDISAPTVDEQWDEVQPPAPREPVSLAAKAAAGRARIEERVAGVITNTNDSGPGSMRAAFTEVDLPQNAESHALPETPLASTETGEVQERGDMARCDSKSDSQLGPEVQCRREFGHTGSHKTADRSWPNA